MAVSNDNFHVTTLIDRSTGESSRVKDIVNSTTTRLAYITSATTDTVGTATLYAHTTTISTTLTISDALVEMGSPEVPYVFTVKDEGGNAGTNGLFIDTGNSTIDGVSGTVTIASDYGAVTLYSDGTDMFTI